MNTFNSTSRIKKKKLFQKKRPKILTKKYIVCSSIYDSQLSAGCLVLNNYCQHFTVEMFFAPVLKMVYKHGDQIF